VLSQLDDTTPVHQPRVTDLAIQGIGLFAILEGLGFVSCSGIDPYSLRQLSCGLTEKYHALRPFEKPQWGRASASSKPPKKGSRPHQNWAQDFIWGNFEG
jgi:hypothetical protein